MNTAPSKPPRAPGYWFALVGFGLGSLESVAFNVLAAFIGPAGYSFELWQSLLPALLGAAVWPVALLVSVEVLARVEWEAHWGWWVVRVGGILLVALASAVISYGHIHAVLKFWKYGWLEAGVGPLVIDGQMLISGFALYAIGRAARAALPASAEASAELPARTPNAPARPVPPGGQEPAVSVTLETPDPATETAPAGGQLPRAARPSIRAVARPAATPPPRRQAKPPAAGSLSDEDLDLVARLRAEIAAGNRPTVGWTRANLGVGDSRARRLVAEATRPELHTVKEVAVG